MVASGFRGSDLAFRVFWLARYFLVRRLRPLEVVYSEYVGVVEAEVTRVEAPKDKHFVIGNSAGRVVSSAQRGVTSARHELPLEGLSLNAKRVDCDQRKCYLGCSERSSAGLEPAFFPNPILQTKCESGPPSQTCDPNAQSAAGRIA